MLDLVLEQAGESEPGVARKTVKWAITCTADGLYTGLVTLAEGKSKGRAFDGCPNLSLPELVGGSEPRAHFLIERLDTVALYLDDKAEEKDREKFAAKHDWFVSLLRQASQDVPYLEVAAKLLTDADVLAHINVDLKSVKAKPTESALVIVYGANPLGDDWRGWWRMFRATLGKTPKKERRGWYGAW